MKTKDIVLLKEILGISPTIKVLEYLSKWKGHDLTLTDIVKGARIGRAVAYEIIANLKKRGVIKQTRIIGKVKFYVLDKSSTITKNIIRLFEEVRK